MAIFYCGFYKTNFVGFGYKLIYHNIIFAMKIYQNT